MLEFGLLFSNLPSSQRLGSSPIHRLTYQNFKEIMAGLGPSLHWDDGFGG